MKTSDFPTIGTRIEIERPNPFSDEARARAVEMSRQALLRDGAIASTIEFAHTAVSVGGSARQVPGYAVVGGAFDQAVAFIHDRIIAKARAGDVVDVSLHRDYGELLGEFIKARDAMRELGEQLWRERSDA